jgi:hypothetical protein
VVVTGPDWTREAFDRLGAALREHAILADLDPDPFTDPVELEALTSLIADLQQVVRELNEVHGAMDQSVDCQMPISAQLQDWANTVTQRIDDALRRYRGQP